MALVVYLDIDGTLLYEPEEGSGNEALDYQHLGEGLEELLAFVVAHCTPYWLSYRAHRGQIKALEERLFPYFPEIARQITPAYWDNYKHEALDLHQPFVWFDDDPEEEDFTWLLCNHRYDSFVRMEPRNPLNPVQILAEIKERLAKINVH